jgi:hypothetical protein
VTHIGEMKNVYAEVLFGKSKQKRPPGRPFCKWENNFKLDLKEI